MDAQQFLAEFRHIANAPNGIVKLRELVLQLAISGRLVDKTEAFQPVKEMLKEANSLREAYEEALRLRSPRMHPPLTKIPYMIPDHWNWERLERLCTYIQRGKGPKYVDKSSTYVVSQKCVQWSGFDLTPARHVADDSLEKYGKERFLCDGDLLWNSTGTGTAGRVAIYSTTEQNSVVADSHVTVIRLANCSPRYFWCVIASPWVQLRIEPSHSDSLVSGTTQQVELNTTTVRALPIPLPPLEEQSRIVAKVDELMALCDQLEAQQQKRRTLQNQLRQATLQAVAASQSPHELQDSWQRLQANFGELFSAPEDVDDAIAGIKNLAVRGLIAPAIQAKPDLEQIKANCTEKRDAYIANGLMRRQKHVGMADNETVYPEHWEITAFDEIAIVIGGVTKGRNLQGKKTVICPYLAVANVQRGYFRLDTLKSIEIVATELPKYLVEKGDLLITEGGDWDKVGRTAIWREEADNILHQNHVFKVRVPSTLIKNEWVELVFNSHIGRDYFAGASKQTTNLASINMTQLRSFPFPIPPLEEQENILTAFSAIANECSAWRKQLERKQQLSAVLATASVSTLTGIAIQQEEEPMKAPQTELVAPVRLGTPPDVKAQAPLATILVRHNGEMSAKDLWQRFGLDKSIDEFYAQLKTEVAHGWLLEPEVAEMREKASA